MDLSFSICSSESSSWTTFLVGVEEEAGGSDRLKIYKYKKSLLRDLKVTGYPEINLLL